MRESTYESRGWRQRSTDDTHNVYTTDLTVIQIAVKLFEEKINKHNNAYIFTDNQSVIQVVDSLKHQSGQYIMKEILDTINKINEAKPTCTIHIEWVPGHKNIEGNVQVDRAAKAAIPSSSHSEHHLSKHKI